MINIRLFCNAGMSTSLLVNSMRKEAEAAGIEADIRSYSAHEINANLEGADVALLGPQISFLKASKQALCDAAGIPLAVIPVRDYGMVDGKAVLDLALSLAKR